MKKFELVVTENEEPRVDSRLLANALGIQHDNLVELIKKHQKSLEEFLRLKRINSAPQGLRGGRPSKSYLLTERQSLNLTTYCRTNSKSILVKDKLVDTFLNYREVLKGNQTKLPTHLETAKQLVASLERVEELEHHNKILTHKHNQDKPHVEFSKAVMTSKDTISMGAVAKVLNIPGIGRTKMFRILRNKKILRWNNEPYQRYLNAGYFKVIEQKYLEYGEVKIRLKTVVFQKGVDYINKKVGKKPSQARRILLDKRR